MAATDLIIEVREEVAQEYDVGNSNDPAHVAALDDPRWREQIKALKEITALIDFVLDVDQIR